MKWVYFIFPVILVFIISALLRACGDVYEYSYENLDEIIDNEPSISRNIPSILSKDATYIKGWYSLESPDNAVEFKIEENNFMNVLKKFSGTHANPQKAYNSYLSYKWHNNHCDTSCEYYVRTNIDYSIEYIAFNRRESYVYYWGYGYRTQKDES